MTREITDKKILEEAARKLDGVNELTIVNSRIVGCFIYKCDEHIIFEFPDKEFMEPEELSATLDDLFYAEDSLCAMNDYPVPVEFAFLPNNSERFFYQLNADKMGFKKWEIYAMRKAIGIDSLIGIM